MSNSTADNKDNERRVVRVVLSAPLLAQVLREDSLIKLDAGIPSDARCVGINYDAQGNSVNVFFEHSSFAATDPAQWPPAVVAEVTLAGDYEQVLLRRVYDEFCEEVDAVLFCTRFTERTHHTALENVINRRVRPL